MRIIFMLNLLIFGFPSLGHHKHGDELQREYYDYDIKGTRKDEVKHNIGHGLGVALTSPFRAVRFSYRGLRNVAHRAYHNAEIFFSDSASINGDQRRVHSVLRGWENSEDLEAILEREHRKGHRFLFGIPYDAYRLLKDMLMAAGVYLPRAGWRALRAAVMGCLDLSGV
jgi:hypothetical protein